MIEENARYQIEAASLDDVSKDVVGLVWLANKDWALAHPRERTAFIAGLKQGIADAVQDNKAAEEVEKKYLKFSAPITNDFNLSLTLADLQFFQDEMLRAGFLQKKMDLADLVVQ